MSPCKIDQSSLENGLEKPASSLKHGEVNAMSNDTSSTNEQVATLKAQVFALVKACPAGRITTYGLIAIPPGQEN
jgi:hypothetical protein